MATTCFCGHGVAVKGIRLRATNRVAAQIQTDLAVFEGALADDLAGDDAEALADLVATGRPLLQGMSAAIHDQPRDDDLKQRVQVWIDLANDHRATVEGAIRDAGFVGSWFGNTGGTVYRGARSKGVVTRVRDTGATVNNDPRIDLTVRVEGPDGTPIELSRTLLVPRTNLPRVNEPVEVAYDPADPSEFVFRLLPATDRAAEDEDTVRIEQLERLVRLRDAGALTDAEFETEKRRVLDQD